MPVLGKEIAQAAFREHFAVDLDSLGCRIHHLLKLLLVLLALGGLYCLRDVLPILGAGGT